MDGCNPERNNLILGGNIPINNSTKYEKLWEFSIENDDLMTENTHKMMNDNNKYTKYLGCTSDGNLINCLFKNAKHSIYALNATGHLQWTYPQKSDTVGYISSVPLILESSVSIINTGDSLLAFENGIAQWSNDITSQTGNISKYGVGFVQPSYFSIGLGDGRFACQ